MKGRLCWIMYVLVQELRKRKFWAVFRFLIDKPYRKDIVHLSKILSKGKMKSRYMVVSVWSIRQSHAINYNEWVDKLFNDLVAGKQPKTLMKVFNDKGRLIVVDGNHRLVAQQHYAVDNPEREYINVKELYYPDEEV